MNTLGRDENGDEILISDKGQFVMMEWERPYMEASIDFLEPRGDVLEIGWGCGYSATQIMKHRPKSYTVIECCPNVLKRLRTWATNYPDIPITIVEGRWQEVLHDLGTFDEIYMDDFPLEIGKDTPAIEHMVSQKRLVIFVDLCIQNHTRIGSKISAYLNQDYDEISLSSDAIPFIDITYKHIDIFIPNNCNYRTNDNQRCTIPLIKKIKDYDFMESQRYALQQPLLSHDQNM